MKQQIIVIVSLLLLLLGGTTFLSSSPAVTTSPAPSLPPAASSPFLLPAPSPPSLSPSSLSPSLPTPSPTSSQIIPQRLLIPKLGIATTVESVGLDANQRMDVPQNPQQVAWYELGPTLGENGSMVIAGHLDTPTGQPGVFYRLGSLTTGDTIVLEGTDGSLHRYVVEESHQYEDATFPLALVFERNDTNRLNLITCSGSFNRSQRNYSHRLVVFSTRQE